MTSAFLKSLFAKCKIHGTGDSQVIISDTEVYSLICMAICDLGWSYQELSFTPIDLPSSDYYQIDLDWFDQINIADLSTDKLLTSLDSCVRKDNDFSLYIENLSALHRRRVKYKVSVQGVIKIVETSSAKELQAIRAQKTFVGNSDFRSISILF